MQEDARDSAPLLPQAPLHEIAEQRERHGDEHQGGGTDDQCEVDELSARHRARLRDMHRRLEPPADRRHHPGRSPGEDQDADEAGGASRGCNRRDGVFDVLPAGRRNRERIDDRVDDVLTEALVLKHEPEDRDEHDRKRRDGEQHPIRDARGLLWTPVAEVSLHGVRNDSDELRNHLTGASALTCATTITPAPEDTTLR